MSSGRLVPLTLVVALLLGLAPVGGARAEAITRLPGTVAGNPAGGFVRYALAYAGDGSTVELGLELATADPGIARATGLRIYGPTAGKLYAATPDSGPALRTVSFASAEAGQYLVQVYSYFPAPVAYTLTANRPLSAADAEPVARPGPAGRPIAVVVENEPAARPQVGLGDADAIYEVVAEFNLTRFVAVYTDASPRAVGPIRSARAYHAAIAGEFGAALAHCLDTPAVPPAIAASRVLDLDACRGSGAGFFRDWGRPMPHNLYAAIPALRPLAGQGGSYGPLARRGGWPAGGAAVGSVSFVYPDAHPVAWRYEPSRREYLRWQDGAPHLDSAGRQIAASTVVVQHNRVYDVRFYGEAGYHEVVMAGQGSAVVYSGGTRLPVTWRRASPAEPTRYYDAAGREVAFPAGRVFFQIVAEGAKVEER